MESILVKILIFKLLKLKFSVRHLVKSSEYFNDNFFIDSYVFEFEDAYFIILYFPLYKSFII